MKAKRRTFSDVAASATLAERNAVTAYIGSKCVEVEALMARGTVDEESGVLLVTRLRAVATDIEAAFHVDEVRA